MCRVVGTCEHWYQNDDDTNTHGMGWRNEKTNEKTNEMMDEMMDEMMGEMMGERKNEMDYFLGMNPGND